MQGVDLLLFLRGRHAPQSLLHAVVLRVGHSAPSVEVRRDVGREDQVPLDEHGEQTAGSGPFQDLDQLEKVPGLTPEMVEDLKAYLTVEVVVEAAPPISTIPELQEAWNSISEGEVDAAVDQYTKLIKQDQHLDEIIRDLQEALVKYPEDASLYQSLGDAYLHANMLQEALDAYNGAEDLIK